MTTVEPLIIRFVVDCLPDHAFQAWTAKINSWWPKDHSLTGDTELTIAVEGRIGGRIVERAADGTEYDWGRITQWDPPGRLSYDWYAGAGPETPTTVELSFTENEGETIVELTHTGWEKLGTDAAKWRNANQKGWGDSLGRYQQFLQRRP